VPLTYNLASKTLRTKGVEIDHATIQRSIRDIAVAEAVPAWTRKQWDDILASFHACQVHVDEELGDATDYIRFTFTHQMLGDEQVKLMNLKSISEAIRDTVKKSSFQVFLFFVFIYCL
jgi:hypothetical protein